MDESKTTAGESWEALSSSEFPFIDVGGSPQEIGLQYGTQATAQIQRSIRIYQQAFENAGVPWHEAKEIARRFIADIRAYSAEFLVEIEAIARGAGVEPEDIIAINARTEILYGKHPATANQADGEPDGCTGAIAMPEATADGHVLHGQNWDWRDECSESAVVLRMTPAKGPKMLMFVEAGILARCGLNSAGIGLTGNFLQSDHDYGRDGVPAPLVRRKILMAESLAEAIKVVFTAPRAFANNLMLSHSGGECIDLEATPREVFWMQADGGLLTHANHFCSPGALAKVKDVGLITNADSLYRHRRVKARLESRAGRLGIEDFKQAFADRYGSPRAVCRSPVAGPGGKTSSTVATIIMDTTNKRMWVAKRPYGPHSYKEYTLE